MHSFEMRDSLGLLIYIVLERRKVLEPYTKIENNDVEYQCFAFNIRDQGQDGCLEWFTPLLYNPVGLDLNGP